MSFKGRKCRKRIDETKRVAVDFFMRAYCTAAATEFLTCRTRRGAK